MGYTTKRGSTTSISSGGQYDAASTSSQNNPDAAAEYAASAAKSADAAAASAFNADASADAAAISASTINLTVPPVIGSVTPNSANFTALNGGQLAGLRNRLINGDFRIDQRLGFLATTIAAGNEAFVGDRWIVSNQTNQPVTAQILYTNVDGSSDNDRRLRIAAVVAPTTGYVYFSQSVERVETFANRTATFSFYVGSGTPITAQAYLVQWFGSGGSANVQTSVVGITLPVTFTKKSASFAVPSTVGKTVGANNHLQVIVGLPIRDLNPVSIAYAQLEDGPVATPFEYRPYGMELALCQRYYETGGAFIVGAAYAGNNVGAHVMYKATKRAAPTVVQTNLSNSNCAVTPTSANLPDVLSGFLSFRTAVAAANTQYAESWVASAEL